MASIIPESATRLQAMAFVNDAELAVIGREQIIRANAEDMAERALRKLISDCVKTEGDYMGYRGQTLFLDVYVLSPSDLHKIIAEARMQGERDALRWTKESRFA